MARTKLTSRKTTGGKAKQFASKASGKSANVNSIVKKAALSPSLKTLISVEKLTHKQVFNALKDNNEIDANLQETIYEGKIQILREGHKNFWEWPKSFLNRDLSYIKHYKILNYLYK